MHQATLETLKCHETEDWASDEVRLEVTADGTKLADLRRGDFDEGEVWRIGRDFDFDRKLELKLYEEDGASADDKLGRLLITRAQSGLHRFTESGARYDLRYSVRPVQTASPIPGYLEDIRTGSSAWRHLNRHDVANDLMGIVGTPTRVRQGGEPFCGPASILFDMVRRRPDEYVRICRDLYRTGKFDIGGHTFEPTQRLRDSRIGTRMSPANWMLMATMRDVENAVFDVAAGRSPFVNGVTTPWEMKGWVEALLGVRNTDYDQTFIYGELDALRDAQRAVRGGGVAYLMIHGNLLRTDSDGSPTDIPGHWPTHWVTFLGGLRVTERPGWDNDTYWFRVFSWRRTYDVVVKEGRFEDGMFGVVLGTN